MAKLSDVQAETTTKTERTKVVLPTEKTPPKDDPEHIVVIVYGPPGIGKTTFCSKAKKALFLASEPGQDFLSTYQIRVRDWEHFLEIVDVIGKGEHDFKTIVLDTIDNLYDMCSVYMRKKLNIDHESDLKYAKGWRMTREEFMRGIVRLSLMPYGLFMISHAETKTIKSKDDITQTREVLSLPPGVSLALEKLAGEMFFCDFEDDGRRIIRTKPTSAYRAKDNSGRLPDTLDLDYEEFIKAYRKEPKKPEPGLFDATK